MNRKLLHFFVPAGSRQAAGQSCNNDASEGSRPSSDRRRWGKKVALAEERSVEGRSYSFHPQGSAVGMPGREMKHHLDLMVIFKNMLATN